MISIVFSIRFQNSKFLYLLKNECDFFDDGGVICFVDFIFEYGFEVTVVINYMKGLGVIAGGLEQNGESF